jgi:hypothetical protein
MALGDELARHRLVKLFRSVSKAEYITFRKHAFQILSSIPRFKAVSNDPDRAREIADWLGLSSMKEDRK